MLEIWEDFIKYNDFEFYDFKNDFDENYNFVVDKQKYQDFIFMMNEKLNKIIKDEIGVDDGSFMLDVVCELWDFIIEQFNCMVKD